MSDIQTRKFKCTGCGEQRPCFFETLNESCEMDDMIIDGLTCMIDKTNQTSFNWQEVQANDAETVETSRKLPADDEKLPAIDQLDSRVNRL